AFAAHGPELRALDLDLGVHLNLTEPLGLAAQAPVMPLRLLIARAYANRLDEAWLDEQLARQFDAFEAVMGRAPDYVDGHQHVHQLPGVLPRLLRLIRQRYGRHVPWLRHTAPGLQEGIPLRESAKARLVGALGAHALARAARLEGLRTNRRLLGVYRLQGGARHYAELLQSWLNNARDGDLLLCHPALPGAGDSLAAQRAAEFEVLACPELGDWMRLNGVRIARPPSMPGRPAALHRQTTARNRTPVGAAMFALK
ncbi:MAG TPA: ChbG/HpnK family deacetylase, partial [Bordetella sp.]|nr:ChbG/HpnK family deacetylase [Bordetella sp.]